jgi:glutamate-1-semialdehyde 2,1-aminomutase
MGKALANGYPISALVGVEALRTAASALFVTGTYWMNSGPMTASLACLDEMKRLGGVPRMEALGRLLKAGIESTGAAAGFFARITGPAAIPFLTFDEDPDLFLNQRFGAAMSRRGIFVHPHHNWFISLAHNEEDIGRTVEAARASFATMRSGAE